MKLNVKAFSLTCAILWGLAILLLTWWIIALEGSTGAVTPLGRVYRGYCISPLGSVIFKPGISKHPEKSRISAPHGPGSRISEETGS